MHEVYSHCKPKVQLELPQVYPKQLNSATSNIGDSMARDGKYPNVSFSNYRQTCEQAALFTVGRAAMHRVVLVPRLTSVALAGIRLQELEVGWTARSIMRISGSPSRWDSGCPSVEVYACSGIPGW